MMRTSFTYLVASMMQEVGCLEGVEVGQTAKREVARLCKKGIHNIILYVIS